MKKFISQADMRIANIYEVLSLIRREGPLTRKEIQGLMGLSWGGVSQIASRLIELGYVYELKENAKNVAGRHPSVLKVSDDDNFIIGMDINKSGLYAEAVNLAGKTVFSLKGSADASDKERFLRDIYAFAARVKGQAADKNVLAVGIAMQGRVDSLTGMSLENGVPGWENVNIAEELGERLGVPIYVNHDPDCILTACTGEKKEDTVLIRIDDGLGMAVMKNKHLITEAGMLEIGNAISKTGERLKALLEDESFEREFSFVLSNVMIIFDVYNAMICGGYLNSHPSFVKGLEGELSALTGKQVRCNEYDAKKAAYGAALYATEEFLSYIK